MPRANASVSPAKKRAEGRAHRSSKNLPIELFVEANDDLTAPHQGRGPQIAARPHGLFKDSLPFSGTLIKTDNFFPFGHRNVTGLLQQAPGLFRFDPLLAGIGDFNNSDLFLLKKLLSFPAGRSTFAQIGPFDLHFNPSLLLKTLYMFFYMFILAIFDNRF